MTIYDDLSPLVSEVMDEFKQSTINLVKITSGTGPIDNPGTPVEVTHSLSATSTGVSFKFVRDGLAVSSDIEVTAAPISGVTPDENDFLTINSIRHKIVKFMPIPPTDTLAWKFIVRKGG